MTILSATVRTMMSICDIFMKTPYGGITTNFTQKNRGMGFALCLCNTKAKLAIKQNDKLEFDEEVKNENTDN
jgi:hypothetical protein